MPAPTSVTDGFSNIAGNGYRANEHSTQTDREEASDLQGVGDEMN